MLLIQILYKLTFVAQVAYSPAAGSFWGQPSLGSPRSFLAFLISFLGVSFSKSGVCV